MVPRVPDIVVVDGLRKAYRPGVPEAVAGISFEVREGEIFGLFGPNGAGKTTTIGAITTRVKPTGGRVTVDGHDVAREAVQVKRRLAVVPQRPNLDRALTALENLTFHAAYFGAPRRERRARAVEIMDRLGLAGREDEKVDGYSGGMAQRLMICRALMHEPRLLILDEPTTGLDPQSRLFLWDAMSDLRERGVTLMLTTHDMVEADRLCDRIAIVDHGKIIALDTPRGLRSRLPAEHGLELVVDGEAEPVAAFARLGWVERVESQRVNDRWSLRLYGTPDSPGGGVLEAAAEAGREVVELKRIEGTLEDVFVHLTGRELRG
jgi:ABC-2 type transport system ATP-binding protein